MSSVLCVSFGTLILICQHLEHSGRFDFHIQLPAPSTSERLAILKHEIQKRSLQCSENVLLDVAGKCDGYDAYDLVRHILNNPFFYSWNHKYEM